MNARFQRFSLPTFAGAGIAAVALVSAGLHFSMGAQDSTKVHLSASNTAETSINCPNVGAMLANVPAAAQPAAGAGIRDLVQSIVTADRNLSDNPQEAAQQVRDLVDQRRSQIREIVQNIRAKGAQAPAGIEGMAECKLADGAANGADPADSAGAGNAAAANGAGNADAAGGAGAGAGAGAGNAEAAAGAGDVAAPANPAVAALTVACPDVASALGVVPADAEKRVSKELETLDRQIARTNRRLANDPEDAAKQLSKLTEDRADVLQKIASRVNDAGGAVPANLEDLAACAINDAGAGNADTGNADTGNADTGNAGAGNAVGTDIDDADGSDD